LLDLSTVDLRMGPLVSVNTLLLVLHDIALLVGHLIAISCGISQCFTYHQTQVNALCLTPARKAGTLLTYPGGMEG